MGGHRRGKQHATPNRRSPLSSSSNPSSSFEAFDDRKNLDFSKVLQEVEGNAFRVTWREILWLLVGIVMLAALSIFMGVAAGITISIHYFDSQTTPSFVRIEARDRDLGPHQHVTPLDPTIVSSNILQKDPDGLDLARVITTTPSGQRNVLLVVEETVPLSRSQNGNGLDNSSGGSAAYAGEEMSKGSRKSQRPGPPVFESKLSESLPSKCPDGMTFGFDDWLTLKAAVQSANALSAEKFMKWNEYFAASMSFTGTFDDDSLYYEEDLVLTVCPGATLRARRGPIFINAENLIIECDGCTLDVGGTHLSFGPHARNVLIRGIQFENAHTTSLAFYHDGAEASFEDCKWSGNAIIHGNYGSVADINSTSTVTFHRCEIGMDRHFELGGSSTPKLASLLTLRS